MTVLDCDVWQDPKVKVVAFRRFADQVDTFSFVTFCKQDVHRNENFIRREDRALDIVAQVFISVMRCLPVLTDSVLNFAAKYQCIFRQIVKQGIKLFVK